ncbi:MAG: hypothetical protein CSB33_04950 [Desulfobacterales bacterium]|nr:MAG: hypothetical protein CSB33_04950 [Desulfobacterales bacterium]
MVSGAGVAEWNSIMNPVAIRKKLPVIFAAAFFLLAVGKSAGAESLYVNGIIKPRLRTGPGMKYETIRRLENGTKVTAGARKNNYIYVTLPDGRDGWVRAYYLRPNLPARFLLQDALDEQKKLKEKAAVMADRIRELEEEKQAILTRETENRARLEKQIAAMEAAAAEPADTGNASSGQEAIPTAADISGTGADADAVPGGISDIGPAAGAGGKTAADGLLPAPAARVPRNDIVFFFSGAMIFLTGLMIGARMSRRSGSRYC